MIEPSSTAFESVPVENTIASTASDANAATGKDKKLAAASPRAASSAIQQKIIPSPRAKFGPKPPWRYSTSIPSSMGNSNDVLLAFQNVIVSTPFASNLFAGI